MVRWRLVILLAVVISLLAAWPVAAARRVKVDVVLIIDTSASMSDELRALCRAVPDVVTDMDQRGIAVDATVLGVAETRACAAEQVTRLIPDGQTQDNEDWGLAVADVAKHYEWTPGAARLIIPMSDEGPLGGDPVREDDQGVIQTAIEAAGANNVMVSPLLGTEFNPEIEPLAQELAQETGGRVFVTSDPDDDLPQGLRDLVMGAAGQARAATTLLEAIPTPRDVLLKGPVIATNLVLAVLLTLVLSAASFILENTWGYHRAAVDAARPRRWMAKVGSIGRTLGRYLSPGEWSSSSTSSRRLIAFAQLALFLILTALVGVFLQPNLNLVSWSGLGLWMGMFLALALVGVTYDVAQYWSARQAGAMPTLRLRPFAPLLTLASVVLSRIAGFVPGYFYGRLTVCAVSPGATKADLPLRRRAQFVLAGMAAVGAVGLSCWILTIPTSLLLDWVAGLELAATLDDVLTGLLGVVQGLFSLVFFFAWQTLFFELWPFPSTGGGVIYRRNRLIWALILFVVLMVLLHALVNPFATAGELLESRGLVLLMLFSFLSAALAVGGWLYSALRPSDRMVAGGPADLAGRATGQRSDEAWSQGQRVTVLAISLIVVWTLAACSGLVVLVARLFD